MNFNFDIYLRITGSGAKLGVATFQDLSGQSPSGDQNGVGSGPSLELEGRVSGRARSEGAFGNGSRITQWIIVNPEYIDNLFCWWLRAQRDWDP